MSCGRISVHYIRHSNPYTGCIVLSFQCLLLYSPQHTLLSLWTASAPGRAIVARAHEEVRLGASHYTRSLISAYSWNQSRLLQDLSDLKPSHISSLCSSPESKPFRLSTHASRLRSLITAHLKSHVALYYSLLHPHPQPYALSFPPPTQHQ